MKRYFYRILVCCLLLVFLVATSADNSKSAIQVGIIAAGAVGALLLAGAAMTPQQQADFYQDLTGSVSDNCAELGQIARGAWQARAVTNTLGQTYLVGRANAVSSSAGGLYERLQLGYSQIGAALQDLLDNNPPVIDEPHDPTSDPPASGEIVQCQDGHQLLIGVYYGTFNYTNASTCASMSPQPCTVSGTHYYASGCYFNGTNYSNKWYTGSVIYDEEPTYPPASLPPDYCDFAAAVSSSATPGNPAYNSSVADGIDDDIASSPPGTWVPTQPGDITDGDIGDGTGIVPEPAPVELPGETPDPTLDNELLRGIYNNTLATARNTATVKDKVAEVKDSVIALPGQIVPPIVGAIQALPAQIAPPIVDPIVAKLEEIKQEIPPPIDSIIAEGNTPTLPANNNYDSSLETPEQLSLSGTILEFISNGLPFVSALGENEIVTENPIPRYTIELYNRQFTFDLEPYEDYLRAMGVLLYSLTVITCFAIVVRK